jgi:hypothetical protein
MSSTNRGAVRREADAYYTPAWAVHLVVPLVPELADPDAVVVDPACGDGGLLAALQEARAACGLKGYDLRPEAVDAARARGLLVWFVDALAGYWGRPAAVVMNPPYSLAMAFVERALAEVRVGGTVAALLRLGFLASGKRSAFMRSNAPNVYVLSKRPSFTNGGTDSADYAWMVWRAGSPAPFGRVEVLT